MTEENLLIKKKPFDSNTIKLIAIIAMTLDHFTWILFPGFPTEFLPLFIHLLGRITCPVMCYCIAEGYHYTRDVNKYMLRLLIFAVVSHFCYVFSSVGPVSGEKSYIPFLYGNVFNQTSVMWSLLGGLVMLRINDSEKIKNIFVKVLLILVVCAVTFISDWSCIAALVVLSFGTNRGNLKKQSFWLIFYVFIYAAVYFFFIDKVYGVLQLGVVLAIPVIALYNGKRGKNPKVNKFMKWFFYLYYPLHLILVGILGLVI